MMKRLFLPLAAAAMLCAQVQTVPNTTFPAVRTILNSNFSWLNTNKASTSATLTINGVTITLGAANTLTTANLTESGNLYFTNGRVLSAMSGLYDAPLTFNAPLSRSVNAISLTVCAEGEIYKYRVATGWTCESDATGAPGGGITSLGGLEGTVQTFADDTNVTISSASTTHTLGWSGTLAIARGGTGAATASQNYVFAGPASGSGAPAFRALVAGDIPSLSYAATNAATTVNGQSCALGSTCTVTGNLPSNPAACSAGQYASDIAADGTLTCGTPAGSGIVSQSVGLAAALPATCTAASAAALQVYYATDTTDWYMCGATNTWLRMLSTLPSAAFSMSGTEQSALATPAAGAGACWFDSTEHGLNCKLNNSATVYRMTSLSTTVLGYLSGITSGVQGQIDGKAASNAATTVNSQTCTLGSSCTVTADPTSAKYKTRVCEIHIWGSGASQVLQDADDEAASCFNGFGATETITGVRCWTNAGSPTVTPIITDGAGAILTGALTCTTTTTAPMGAAGTLSGTPTLASTGTIDANVTSAGGTATNIRIFITLTR